ncbi:MAG TPA: ABC transporter permease, partial [Acidimicrobiales bacterium]|nr:ABC transporter permease [Acidimicrobiales bacterium]
VAASLTAGMALFFVFFAAGMPLVSTLDERSRGTLARILAAPVPAMSVAAGKAAAAIVLGIVSIGSLAVASTLLLGADWGPPLGVALLVSAAVISATGIMAVAGVAARTTEQAGNAQGIVAVVLALLGGGFAPVNGSAGGFEPVARFTPHGRFLGGLEALQDGVAAALPSVAALLAMGVVTGAIGLAIAGRTVRP